MGDAKGIAASPDSHRRSGAVNADVAMIPEELPVKEGILSLLGLGSIGLFWRAYRMVRKELREDGASEKTAGTYKAIIAELEAQVGRLEKRLTDAEGRSTVLEDRIKAMSQRITDEINERYRAETALRRMESERNALRADLDEIRKGWENGGL